MAARRPFWKWHRWKSIGFCLWPPSTCIWNLKLKFQSKLDLCSGNHVVYRQTDGRTRWIQYTPLPTSLGGGIMMASLLTHITDLYQIDLKQRRSRPSDRKSRAPGADRPRPQREFARAPLAASNSTDTTAFATGYIACTVHRSLNIVLQTTWLCTQT